MVIYAIGVSMAGFASDIYFMIFARIIQGIGMSMFPIAFGMIRDQFPREKISIGQGVITSMFASGAVIGLLAGGIIINNYGWHATFLSTIPIAIALFLIIWRFDHEAKKPQQPQSEVAKPAYIPAIPKGVDIKGALTLATFV